MSRRLLQVLLVSGAVIVVGWSLTTLVVQREAAGQRETISAHTPAQPGGYVVVAVVANTHNWARNSRVPSEGSHWGEPVCRSS